MNFDLIDEKLITADELEAAKAKAIHNGLTEIEWQDRYEKHYLNNSNPSSAGINRFYILRELTFGIFLKKLDALLSKGYTLHFNYAQNVDANNQGQYRVVLVKPLSEQQDDIKLIRDNARKEYVKQVQEDYKAYAALKRKANTQIKQLQMIKNQITESQKVINKLDKQEVLNED
ncbi:hypothetical protein [Nitrincola alkalilacustris]|uniref:hypothetical protein n=1 Tax=Nitrincola alkalilacustris TaxID=1571224 RepID=UPI00124F4515|nr:hypothetical protein [Nitrincola alkalilacustris]